MPRRGNKPVEVRVDDEMRARWEAAARDYGQSLPAFIRDTVEAAVTAPEVTKALLEMQANDNARRSKRKTPKPPKATPAASTAVCPRERFHRPGTFCKECKTVPA